MRQRFNDFLHLDENGLIHFPPEWTEEAKENWMEDLRNKPSHHVPGVKVVYVKGIYRGDEAETPPVISPWP